MKREKGRDPTQYTNLCGLNTLPHLQIKISGKDQVQYSTTSKHVKN